jgi:metal-sulfur cluster biosynthetic enzyme
VRKSFFDAHQGLAARRGLNGGMDPEALPEDVVRGALRSVEDPEAGMSIVDLGLVYAVHSEPGRVRVEMTMTSPACPAAPYLVDEAAAAIRAIAPDGTDVSVELVWDPPWTPERMSDDAQEKFGWK